MKFFLSMFFLLLSSGQVLTCQGVEVDACEAVVSPSSDKCRSRYEILFEMHASAPNKHQKDLRGMQCGYSGLRCVRMGSLCTDHSF